jgi:pimeloyl-ACP methyl ester carboxylesterase
VRFARALFDRGWSPVAPDLPGFGESVDAKASAPSEHAALLAKWAGALGIRDAVWIGHSVGCNAVAHLAAIRPDLVREAIHIGPLWTRSRFPQTRMAWCLALDAFREPLRLYAYVIAAYWRAGVWRWWRTFRRYVPDFSAEPPSGAEFIAGERDPLPDASVSPVRTVPGAHACHFSHPEQTADRIEN